MYACNDYIHIIILHVGNNTPKKFIFSTAPACTKEHKEQARGGKEEVGRDYEDKEDVWYIKREYWTGDQKTPTKLPAELIKKILMYSSEKGDVVLDPFLGLSAFHKVESYYDAQLLACFLQKLIKVHVRNTMVSS